MQYHVPMRKQGRVVTNKDAILYQLGKQTEVCAMRVMRCQKGTKVNKRSPKEAKKENVPRRGFKKKRREEGTITLCVVL